MQEARQLQAPPPATEQTRDGTHAPNTTPYRCSFDHSTTASFVLSFRKSTGARSLLKIPASLSACAASPASIDSCVPDPTAYLASSYLRLAASAPMMKAAVVAEVTAKALRGRVRFL